MLIVNEISVIFALFHTFLATTFYFLVLLQSVE